MPEPLAPPVTVSQDADEVADQEQAELAVTVIDPDEASSPDEMLAGATATSHVPAWLTLTVRPETVRELLRGDAEVLAATTNVTAAFPLLFGPAPDVTVIHGALLNVVQTQFVGMVTKTTREPPPASNDSDDEETIAVHGAPAWITFSNWPPIAIVPLLEVPAGFASTRYETVPAPEPDAPLSTVIHGTLGTAVHAHPPGNATFVLKLAPPVATLCAVGLSVAGAQLAPA